MTDIDRIEQMRLRPGDTIETASTVGAYGEWRKVEAA